MKLLKGLQGRPAERRRCVIYARKSDPKGLDQRFSSIDSQYAAGITWIAQHPGAELVGELRAYSDGGRKGNTLNRPGFRKLMADAKAGLFDTVVVVKLDRIA